MPNALSPIKVDASTDELISHAAHFLGTSKKHIVNDAVREYVERHRDEIQEAALEALRTLDGTTKSAVQLLTGATDAELDELGGLRG
ncbi:hypothetical protein [Gulosibacter sp. 10]|uniref:hypothetical protein n=1 Tax=Gulosibacter sp. 10 TaxID=1255570 RepID=UPI00097F168B|nr:hypothetical protein [Gulosibacter sp. 10]SJM63946.1 hypothetical protein FM112_09640 [Gulosibacter sp. 10]